MILLVNGPNLNLLGEREPEIYGRETLFDVERMVRQVCAERGVEVKAFQSNSEGALLDFIQAHRKEAEGVILNPGALSHTSRALPDCLRALKCPTVEVHLSNIHARESWRRESFVSEAARGGIFGLGVLGYKFAAEYLCRGLGGKPRVEPPSVAEAEPAKRAQLQGFSEEPLPVDPSARGDYE